MTVLNSQVAINTKPNAMVHLAPAVLTVVVVLLSVGYRNPLLFTDPQMFSEDIFVFFNEDRLFGSAALVKNYSGYLQFPCRLIAFLVGYAPARYAAGLYAASFIAVILATSLVLYTSPIFQGWGKVLAALALVCSPTNSEVFFGMCYTQWIIAPTIALAMYESPTTRRRSALLITCFAMNALSSPLVIIAAPFVIWKAISERTRYAACLIAMTALSAVIQLPGIFIRSSSDPSTGTIFERASAVSSIFYSWLTGPDYPGFAIALLISIPSFALMTWYLWRNRRIAHRAALYFVAYGTLPALAGCLHVGASLHANQFLYGARYFYVTVVLIVLTFIVIEQNSQRSKVTFPFIAVILGSIYAAHVTNMNFHMTHRTWTEMAWCIEHSSNCVTLMNPGNTGHVRAPSDAELRTLSKAERLQFRITQRTP